MSRTGSDREAADSTPAVTSTTQDSEELELSSADPFSGTPADGGPPFGDWRQQLRDRVREIRARKLVDKRPIERGAGALGGPADAARDEKLPTAREHAAMIHEDSEPSSSAAEAVTEPAATPEAAPDDLANLMEALLNPPEGLEPLIEPPAEATARETEDWSGEWQASARPDEDGTGEWQASTSTEDAGAADWQAATSLDDEGPPDWQASTPQDDKGVSEWQATTGPSLDDLPVESPASVAAANLTELAPSDAQASEDLADVSEFGDAPQTEKTELPDPLDPTAPPDAAAVPLFQDDAQLIDDNPLSEIAEAPAESASAEPVAPLQATPPLDGFRTEIPAWSKLEAPGESLPPAAQPPPPADLAAIPDELAEIDIPAWAVPRQRDDTEGGSFATSTPGQLNAEALLAGDPLERAAATRDPHRRPRPEATATPEPSPRPPTVPDRGAPANEATNNRLARADVHLIGEYSAGTTPASQSGLGDPAKTAAPPPSADTAPVSTATSAPVTEPQPTAAESVTIPEPVVSAPKWPSAFEPNVASETPPAVDHAATMSGSAETQDDSEPRFPGLFDPVHRTSTPEVAPIETDNLPTPTQRESQPATDTAMEWDLEAPSDPDTILDAQRDPMDPTAPMSDRVFSALADALVLTTIAVVLMVGGASVAGTGALSFVQAAPVPFAGAWLIFGLGYGIFFVGTCGQTLGKMAMRIRVIGSNRFRVGYGKATIRTLSYAAAMLPVGLGLVLALKDVEHRALHDRLSGTRVVKA